MSVCQEPLSQERLEISSQNLNYIPDILYILKKKRISIKDMVVYIGKNAYVDTIMGIKINRVLPVDIDL